MVIKEIISKMTLEEKARLCSGKNVWETEDISRLGIPSIMMADGPHGLRKQYDKSDNLGVNSSIPSTCFPTAATSACSFDRNLLKKMGEAVANECIEHDVDIILGPGVNIKRSPLCGRNFEYFSEDPYLTGELGAAFVSGAQGKGIGVSVKHYCGNNQEKLRNKVSSVIDERALREIYLAGFERIVKEKPYTLMCSYNRLNGEYASENKYLLTDILRDEWGFDGVVVTDWGACNDRVLGLVNGQDLEMPSSFGINDQKIIEAVKNGKLDEGILDRTVERILNLVFKCKNNDKSYSKQDNHLLAKEVADNSIVLLKNEGILPIKDESVGIIGKMAKVPRYQGSGSSRINPVRLENVFDCLTAQNKDFIYADGYLLETDKCINSLLEDAISIAKKVHIPIVFIGLTDSYESEGFDRTHIDIPEAHNRLVEEIAKVNPNVVVVLSGGAPVSMPWIGKVKGLINSYLSGESGAMSIVDILYGKVNPSGKLAETYPVKLQDTPSYSHFPGGNNAVYYAESIYVGYRYYEKKGQEVLFPFGYGLSYTTFDYRDIRLNKTGINDNEILEVSLTVKNTGRYPGAEVCELYVKALNPAVFKPVKELKGFEKVYLEIGEEKTVNIKLDRRAFSYYNVQVKDWVVESGFYEIIVGSSSVSENLTAKVFVHSHKEVPLYYDKEALENYYNLKKDFSVEDFRILYDKPLEPLNVKVKRPYDYNSTIAELSHTLVGKLFVRAVKKQIKKTTTDVLMQRMMLATLMDLPYRTLMSFSGDTFTKDLADGLLLIINRHYIKGLKKLLNKKKMES